jgi:hypothetical protein
MKTTWVDTAPGVSAAVVNGVGVRVREVDHERRGVVERVYSAEVESWVGWRSVGTPKRSTAAARRVATRRAKEMSA